MDWIKVKVKHAEYDFASAPDNIFRAWIMMMIMVAVIERKPLRKDLCNRLGKINYENLEKHLAQNDISIDTIIDKILEDVDHVNSRKAHNRKYMRKYRGKTLRKPLRGDHVKGKRREEKIREEKSIYKEKTPLPTVEEVTKYCTERANGVNPQRFIDFYTSKGWMIGKNKMKDWRAAVRTWENKDDKKPEWNLL